MSTGKQAPKHKETNHVIDYSGDPKYFVMIPRLIWARARDTYDYLFYAVVKDIAGENGECWLGTEDLARMCKMSEGKAADCREFWLSTGFIAGEQQSIGEGRFVWHLKIQNIWEENARWSEENPTIDDRLDHAVEQRESSGKGYVPNERICNRCQRPFTATGRRSKRCPECAKLAQMEQTAIYKIIKMPVRDFVPAGATCAKCGCTQSIEPHLVDIATHEIIFLCEKCHDDLHREPAGGINYPMNYPDSASKPGEDKLSHELSGEIIHAIDYPPPDKLWDELKNNHLKNHTEKKNQEPDGSSTSPPLLLDNNGLIEIWQMISDQLKMQMRRDSYVMYIKPARVIGQDTNVLQIGVPSDRIRDWNNSRVKPIVARLCGGLLPPDACLQEISFITASIPPETQGAGQKPRG